MPVAAVGWASLAHPRASRWVNGGAWKPEAWMDLCAGRRIELQFQGTGARPRLLGRRCGLARGIYNRVNDDDRPTKKQNLSEVQWCLETIISAKGFSAYHTVFVSNPVDLFGWGDTNADLMFTQDASPAGQFVEQGRLRMHAREAELKEVANSKLRSLLAYGDSFNCADVNISDTVLL